MADTVHRPPGPPVVGSVPKLASDPLRFLTGVQQAYGGQYPIARLEPPGQPPVNVVLDSELVHEVLGDREQFVRPDAGLQEERRQGLLSSNGDLWEQQRSILEPSFSGSNLAGYADTAAETAGEMTASWPQAGEVDLLDELSMLTMRVITRALFSQDTTAEQSRTVTEALDVVASEFEPSLTDFLLPERLQPGPSEAFETADEQLEAVATEFVDRHRRQADPPEDMLTALLEAQQDPAVDLADNELVDEAILFMTAGQETTALTIAYAFYWLSEHPEIRDAVAEEAAAVLDGDAPEWGDLADLTLTEQVVRETLRLTPAAWSLGREAQERTTLRGTTIEAGESLVMSPYAHHRDERQWVDPTSFDPRRWEHTASRASDAYFPFGSGPRVCIGRQIALLEAQFTIAHVLQGYDVEVTTDSLDLTPGVTLRPGNPIHARVTARE